MKFYDLLVSDIQERKRTDPALSLISWITDRSFWILLCIRLSTSFSGKLIKLAIKCIIEKPAQLLLVYSVPHGLRIGKGMIIYHGDGLIINAKAIIGDRVTIYSRVCIGERFPGDKCPSIGNDVILGTGCCILGPVVIPDGAKVRANAVITPKSTAGMSLIK